MELQFEGVCIGFTNIDNTHVNADNQFSLSISRSVCSIMNYTNKETIQFQIGLIKVMHSKEKKPLIKSTRKGDKMEYFIDVLINTHESQMDINVTISYAILHYSPTYFGSIMAIIDYCLD